MVISIQNENAMNRLRIATILVASLLLIHSCGGPKDGKPISNAVIQGETDSTDKHNSLSEVKQPEASVVETSKNKIGFFDWILIGLVLAEGVYIVFVAVKVKQTRERVGDLESRLSRRGNVIRIIENDRIKLTNEFVGSKSKNPSYAPQPPRQINPKEQEPIAKKPNSETSMKVVPLQPPTTADSEYVFLKHFKDGILEVESKEQAFFQATFEVGGKEGHFEFIGDVRKAIANKNSILDDVCETPKFNRDATQIITDKWGKCIKQQDGRWLVTQKAILSFK